MQTHFSSCTGVADVKVDRSASKVAVFGKADQSRVLKKLKKVDCRAKAISVDKKNLQQGPVGPKPAEQEYQLRSSYYSEILQQSERCVQGKYAPYLQGSLVMGVPAIQPHNSNGQRDTSASSLTSSSNEPTPPSEEHPSLQQLRDGSDPSTVGALVGTTTTQDFSTQATTPGMGSGEDSQLESHEYNANLQDQKYVDLEASMDSVAIDEKLKLAMIASGCDELGSLATEVSNIAERATVIPTGSSEVSQVASGINDTSLIATQGEGEMGDPCMNSEDAMTEEHIFSLFIQHKLKCAGKAIGVTQTPVDFMEACHGDVSEPVVTFGWRGLFEENRLEMIFPNAKCMSSILGVGIEFAKVVVDTSLKVNVIGIKQDEWEAKWQDALDKSSGFFDIVSIAMTGMMGPRHELSTTDYLTGKQSAKKHGVGLQNCNDALAYMASDDNESNYCLVLYEVLEYLLLKKVDAMIGKQCAGDGSSGQNTTGRENSANQTSEIQTFHQVLSLLNAWSLKGHQKSPGDDGDDDGGDEPQPSQEKQHKHGTKKFKKDVCEITVHPGAGGSFEMEGLQLHTPEILCHASIDPTFEFEFEKNGRLGKQIKITVTTSFDLGKAAPLPELNDVFGWYQNPIMVSLRNCGDGILDSQNCELKEDPKETKIVAKTGQTHSNCSTSQNGAQVQGGYHNAHLGPIFQVMLGINKTKRKEETFAQEEAYENSSFNVLRGFQCQDRRSARESLLEYRFYRLPPVPVEVLHDPIERQKYLGFGMCEAVQPTFAGMWLIKPNDMDEHSSYIFFAERTLNQLLKVDQKREDKQVVQSYRVPIYVNHAMTHLYTIKHEYHILKEHGILPNVMRVGIVG